MTLLILLRAAVKPHISGCQCGKQVQSKASTRLYITVSDELDLPAEVLPVNVGIRNVDFFEQHFPGPIGLGTMMQRCAIIHLSRISVYPVFNPSETIPS